MTKKKFISDYTERFWFYMLEWDSDGNAVKKVPGEVYDKMKRPTERIYYTWCEKETNNIYSWYEYTIDMMIVVEEKHAGIYQK